MPADPNGALRQLAADLDALFVAVDDQADAAADYARAAERSGEHPSIIAGLYRVRDHLRQAQGMVGASSGKLNAVRSGLLAANAAQAAQDGPARPAWPGGPVCTCGHVLDVHDGRQGWCTAPVPCPCARFAQLPQVTVEVDDNGERSYRLAQVPEALLEWGPGES